MKVKARIFAVLALAIAAVALLAPAAQAGPGTQGDAHDRSGAALSTATMQDAHQRVGIASQLQLLVGVDAHERSVRPTGSPSPSSASSSSTTFAWGAALTGAGATLVFVGLIALVLLIARRERGLAVP